MLNKSEGQQNVENEWRCVKTRLKILHVGSCRRRAFFCLPSRVTMRTLPHDTFLNTRLRARTFHRRLDKTPQNLNGEAKQSSLQIAVENCREQKTGFGGEWGKGGRGEDRGGGEVKVREGWGGEGGAQNRQVRSFQHRPIHICYTYIAISTIYYRMWDEAQRKHRGRAQYFGCNILFWIKKKKILTVLHR